MTSLFAQMSTSSTPPSIIVTFKHNLILDTEKCSVCLEIKMWSSVGTIDNFSEKQTFRHHFNTHQ